MRIKVIRTPKDINRLCKTLRTCKEIGFDTEAEGPLLPTTGNKKKTMINVWKSRLVGASIAVRDDLAFYIPVCHADYALGLSALETILSTVPKDCVVWAHNWKFDLTLLQVEGLAVPGLMADSMVAAWLSGKPKPYGLKSMLPKFVAVEVKDFDEVVQDRKLSTLRAREIKKYAGIDAIGTYKVGRYYYSKIVEQGLGDWFWNTEMPCVRAISKMETAGIAISENKLLSVAKKCRQEMARLEDKWATITPRKELSEKEAERYQTIIAKNEVDLFGNTTLNKREQKTLEKLNKKKQSPIDIGSGHQLRRLYAEDIWTTGGVQLTKTGLLSVDTASIQTQLEKLSPDSLGYRLAEIKAEHANYSKIYSTYTFSLVRLADCHDDGRLRGTFHQTGTNTGRLSSSAPNMQNFPNKTPLSKEVLSAFRPSTGNVFISADYSQIELRILAHVSGDKNLMEAYLEDKDIHQHTADLAGVTRTQAKTLNFGIVYGMGPHKLARTLKVSVPEATTFMDNYKKAYPDVDSFMRKMHAFTERRGYSLSLAHRRRMLPDARIVNEADKEAIGKKKSALRKAGNNPMQAGASDIMKVAMVRIQDELNKNGLGDDVFLVSQIHDDIILDVPVKHIEQTKTIVKRCMEKAWDLRVPLKVIPKVGHSFADLKDE